MTDIDFPNNCSTSQLLDYQEIEAKLSYNCRERYTELKLPDNRMVKYQVMSTLFLLCTFACSEETVFCKEPNNYVYMKLKAQTTAYLKGI